PISGKELSALQAQLRNAHKISPETINTAGTPRLENPDWQDLVEQLPTVSRNSHDTSRVSCWINSERDFGSRFARSKILVSPDGRRRAYAEAEAGAFKPKIENSYGGPRCANITTLFISDVPG